jgi:hypothetical protein
MTYLLPAVIEPPDYIKICVTIPNRQEYIDAFLGSYNYLGRWTAWKQDGTTRARDAARVWLVAIQDTISRWENCEEDMAIINNYVNVSCGGCGSTGLPTTIVCYLQDGTPVITPQPPVEPNPPPLVGEEWPMNPIGPPPEQFEDWTAYDGAACVVANLMWAVARSLIQVLENLGDILATLAALMVTVVALLPASVTAAFGGAALIEILKAYGTILASEQTSNIMLYALEWLDERKQEIICTIYSGRYNLPQAMINVVSDGANYVSANVTMTDIEKSGLYEFFFEVFPTSLPFKWLSNMADITAVDNPIDCATCGEIGGGVWTPGGEGSFCTNDGIDYQVYPSGLQFSGNISKEGEFGSYEYTLSVVPASGETHQFEGRNLSFYSVNSRTVPCIITATTSGGDQQVTVSNDTTDTLDLTGLTVTAVQFKWQIGIYNLACPQELSGYVTWEDV